MLICNTIHGIELAINASNYRRQSHSVSPAYNTSTKEILWWGTISENCHANTMYYTARGCNYACLDECQGFVTSDVIHAGCYRHCAIHTHLVLQRSKTCSLLFSPECVLLAVSMYSSGWRSPPTRSGSACCGVLDLLGPPSLSCLLQSWKRGGRFQKRSRTAHRTLIETKWVHCCGNLCGRRGSDGCCRNGGSWGQTRLLFTLLLTSLTRYSVAWTCRL